MKKVLITILAAAFGLGGLTYAALCYYAYIAEISLSLFGYIVMGVGVFLAYGLGCGLMALAFFSNRHGHDDSVHSFQKTMNDDSLEGFDDSDSK